MVTGEVGDNAANQQLILFVERIERLKEERKGINDDIKDVKAEAKANGYDPKIMEMVMRVRAMERHTYQEQQSLLGTYLAAFGIED